MKTMQKKCQGCGKKFECEENVTCWCRSLRLDEQKLKILNSLGDDCYCENCLMSKSMKKK